MSRANWILLVVLASLWGASYLFIKVALDDVSPAMVVFARTALAALVLLPVAVHAGALAGLRTRIGPLTVLAAVQIVAPFLLISTGEQHISSSLAGILVATAPIFTFLLAIKLDETSRVRGVGAVGVGLGIGGVALLLGVDTGGGFDAIAGGAMVVLASLGYALGSFYLKRTFAGGHPIGLVAAAMAVSAVITLPPAAATLPGELPGLDSLASLAALGVVGSGVSFVIYYTLIARVGPGKASLVAYLAPGFAVVYGVVLLDEGFGPVSLAGLLLIVGGSWLAAEGRLPWQPRRRALERQPLPENV